MPLDESKLLLARSMLLNVFHDVERPASFLDLFSLDDISILDSFQRSSFSLRDLPVVPRSIPQDGDLQI